MPLYYAIGLLVLFYVLLVGEFFLPTGGLMGVAALLSAATAIFIAFTHSTAAGVTMIMIIATTTPFIFIGVVRLWPHTPIGKRILNRRPGQLSDGLQRTQADGTPLNELVGRTGTAQTDMLPSGQILIGSLKMNAVSTGMPIDRGSAIVIVRVIAGKVQVRPADADDLREVDETPRSPESLEMPLESLDADSLD